MLKEMDALSVELIGYNREKRYLEDGLKHSDEILDRYSHLITLFDDRKEQLYHDIHRICESYLPESETNPWYGLGQALLHALDLNKAILFDVRDLPEGAAKQPARC